MWSLQQLIDEGKLVNDNDDNYYRPKGCRIYLGDFIDAARVDHVEKKVSHCVVVTIDDCQHIVLGDNIVVEQVCVVLQVVEPSTGNWKHDFSGK